MEVRSASTVPRLTAQNLSRNKARPAHGDRLKGYSDCQSWNVTLSGDLRYVAQRGPIVSAADSIAGVSPDSGL
jgi:hypothetical protein